MDDQEHEDFRRGIVRLLSNFMAHEVKKQYMENPAKFSGTRNILEEDDEEDTPLHPDGKKEEDAADVDINKLPFM